MVFLRSVTANDPGPVINARRLSLRTPLSSDYQVWAELRARSRDHLTPWEPQWSNDELSRAAFRRRLRYYMRDLRDETGFAFFVFRNQDDRLIGGLSLSNIRRGVTQSGVLGYWCGLPHTGCGYMTEAVSAAMSYAFDVLRLHRIEAACVPHNRASVRVLEKSGFVHEGLAREYLKINGFWQDHLLFALLKDDVRP